MCGFDMTQMIAHPKVLVPVVSYLLHRVMLLLEGSPAIVAMTEAWRLLDNPLFAPRLKEWLDTLRNNNAMAVLATEEIAQASGSGITQDADEQCGDPDLPAG